MSIRRKLSETIGLGPEYQCAFCGLSFETEREYCPACGSAVRAVRN